MEAEQPAQTINNNKVEEEEVEDDEEFYEKIEAPKFVDFTVSEDPFRPDDRYWFCLRVGCDRKHEEELDPEEISKNFVLRVMAARSPNIRLRKALNGRNASTNVKCPLSAPAKSSKSRVSRLAMVSTLSEKMLDVNGKVGALLKTGSTSTPKVKTKQVAAKYMTTPRNKRCLPNENAFRSVQNPRPTTTAVPKSQLIAKALVFHSPKKTITLKTSMERTPLRKLCEGMKKLEITSQRKRVLGYSSKFLKGTRCDTKNPLPVDSSRRQLSVRIDRSRAKDMIQNDNSKDKEAKSICKVKSKSKQMLTKQPVAMPKKMSKDDSSDMEIDVKSRGGSALNISIIEENVHKEHLKMTKLTGNVVESRDVSTESSDTLTTATNSVMEIDIKSRSGSSLCNSSVTAGKLGDNLETTKISGDSRDSKKVVVLSEFLPSSTDNLDALTNSAKGEMNSLANSKGMDLPKSHARIEEGVEDGERREEKDILKLSSEDEGSHEDNQDLRQVEHEHEVMDSDDKENTQVSDENRNSDHNNPPSERKFLGRKETHEKNKKVLQTVGKNLKDGATTGAPDVKYKKPKPTNPKPFRLRTDERGILKEANLERKIYAPQKQAATVSRFLGGNSKRRRRNNIKGNEKCSEQSSSIDKLEFSDKEPEKKVKKAEAKWDRTAGLQTSRALTPQRQLKSLKPKLNDASQETENSLRKLQSPSLHRQIVRPQGKLMASLITPRQQPLSVIKETSSRASKSKSAGKPHESGVTTVTKTTVSAASRSSSQGRRPLTVPKEPSFRSTVLKSCTTNTA